MDKTKFQLFISTAPNQEVAESLSKELVGAKLAACVNIIPSVTSVYEWQGKVEQESELILLIKSKPTNFSKIEAFFEKHHPYDVPELISCNIEQVSASYGQWLQSILDFEHE